MEIKYWIDKGKQKKMLSDLEQLYWIRVPDPVIWYKIS